jgi:hypothetical protein
MVAGMEPKCTCNSLLAARTCSIHPCPFCVEKDSRIRQLEEKIDGPFGYKATVEKLTQAVYDWEQGQILMSARIRELEDAVKWICHGPPINKDGSFSGHPHLYRQYWEEIIMELRRRARVEGG